MAKPIFTRKLVDNHGSLQVNVPAEIAKALALKKGDYLVIVWENGSFTCSKMKGFSGLAPE